MKKIFTVLLFVISTSLTFLPTTTFAGALLVVTLNDGQSSKITWQCEDVTECVERIITRVEEHGSCDERVQKIEITKTHIPGLDD